MQKRLPNISRVRRYLSDVSPSETDKLDQMEQAVRDPLFMADLHETMSAFAGPRKGGK